MTSAIRAVTEQPAKSAQKKAANLMYRPDIDGLRAIAVLAVILYHFKVPFFTGGFVGVDIFFVISGYLITTGILNQHEKSQFEFGEFYTRRVRRLIPALLFTIATSYIVSALIFSPNDFKQMSGSAVYALGGLSNIFFWLESGYFDSAATIKPLLHTWSLSVEIQFYIIWPIILLLICRKTNNLLIPLLGLITAGLAAAYSFLRIDAVGAFFLTPFRIHEFLLGSLVVVLERGHINKSLKEILYAVGLALVTAPIFLYDSDRTLFPGLAALAPSLGAALMILSGDSSVMAGLCRSWPAKKIGEISYSLYLVHWPLYVFASYLVVRDLAPTETVTLITANFLFAAALFTLIERPFRSQKETGLSGTNFALASLGCATIIMIAASSSWGQNGWEWRVPKEIRNITNINKLQLDKYTWATQLSLDLRPDFDADSGKQKILIIGDSQAADVANMLSESDHASEFDIVSRIVVTDCATPMIEANEAENFFNQSNPFTIKRPELITPCQEQITRATNTELLNAADRIYISMLWRPFALEYNLRAIQKIASLTKATVYIVGRKDLTKSSIEITSSLGRIAGLNHHAARFHNPEVDITSRQLSKVPGTKFVDMMKLICETKDSCIVLTDKNKPIFFDREHLTKEGAQYVGRAFYSTVTGNL